MSSVSVQFGCGWDAPAGWLNFDASPTLLFERIPLIGSIYTKNAARFPRNVKYGNIVTGLPLQPGCVDRLYASHVIEHLAYDDAIRALNNCLTILKPGGVFRLIVPDLRERARRYLLASESSDPMAAATFLDSTLLGQRHRPKGLMAILGAAFGGSDHRWMWDEPALTKALRDVGFAHVRRCQFGDSDDSSFALVESQGRFIDGDIHELALECRKAPPD